MAIHTHHRSPKAMADTSTGHGEETVVLSAGGGRIGLAAMRTLLIGRQNGIEPLADFLSQKKMHFGRSRGRVEKIP